MNDTHNKVFKAMKKDNTFKNEFVSIKGNRIPFFPSEMEKALFATAYMGWMVGKYGTEIGAAKYKLIKRT